MFVHGFLADRQFKWMEKSVKRAIVIDRSIEKLPGCERLQCYSKFFLLNFSVYLYL